MTATAAEAIKFTSVCFRHSAYADNIIDSLSIKIKTKPTGAWRIHLDGSTGSGKTTFLNLLLGFAKPTSGIVEIFGHNIAELSQDDRNKLIQLVDRAPTITTGSVFQNIHLGLRPSNDAYLEAIQQLGLHKQTIFTQQLQRYLQDDSGISTGQGVMIALVRAALIKPKILLLDEALASLPEELHLPILDGFSKMGINILIVQHGDSNAIHKLPKIDTKVFQPAGRTKS